MAIAPVDHAPDLLRRAIVCIADRDLEQRLRDGLAGAGYQTSCTSSLSSVGEQLAADEPAVVISDDRQHDWLRDVVDLVRARPLSRPVVLLSADKADEFLAKRPHSLVVAFDPLGTVAAAFRLSGMPSTAILDRQGEIRFRHVGYTEKTLEKFRSEVLLLLGES